MNEQEFTDLVQSIKQAGEIKRGQRKPGRVFEFTPMDIKEIRQKLDKSRHGSETREISLTLCRAIVRLRSLQVL